MRSIVALYTYPVKSFRGVALDCAQVGQKGIEWDREWMVVDAETHDFLSQRKIPKMALVDVSILKDLGILILRVDNSVFRPQAVPLHYVEGEDLMVTVHQKSYRGIDQGDGVAKWLSAVLDYNCRLVRFPQNYVRFSGEGLEAQTAFADKWSIYAHSQESVGHLNSRLPDGAEVGDNRFRPNIVLAGCSEPHEEDRIAVMQIKKVLLRGGTMCQRCTIPGVDQDTGEQTGMPLATLRQYRHFEGGSSPKIPKTGTYFGRNFDHVGRGEMRVGDSVEVLAWD